MLPAPAANKEYDAACSSVNPKLVVSTCCTVGYSTNVVCSRE